SRPASLDGGCASGESERDGDETLLGAEFGVGGGTSAVSLRTTGFVSRLDHPIVNATIGTNRQRHQRNAVARSFRSLGGVRRGGERARSRIPRRPAGRRRDCRPTSLHSRRRTRVAVLTTTSAAPPPASWPPSCSCGAAPARRPRRQQRRPSSRLPPRPRLRRRGHPSPCYGVSPRACPTIPAAPSRLRRQRAAPQSSAARRRRRAPESFSTWHAEQAWACPLVMALKKP